MNAKSWDELWKGKENLMLWSKPDAKVINLIPMLKDEGVKKILDLGCGIGRHVVAFAQKGFNVYGIDSSHSAIEHCQRWLKLERLKASLIQGDMINLTCEDGFFDFILSWNVIYHGFKDTIQASLAEIGRVLKVGGLLYLTLNSTRNTHYGEGTEMEPGTFENPTKGNGQHLHHYSSEVEVKQLFEGWQIISIAEKEEALGGKLFPGSWHWMILARKTPLLKD